MDFRVAAASIGAITAAGAVRISSKLFSVQRYQERNLKILEQIAHFRAAEEQLKVSESY